MIHPTIHLNGTSRNQLMEEWNDAYAACNQALLALLDASPHSRDYYLTVGAYMEAVVQHVEQADKIREVMGYIDALRERAAG